ncbi:MAG TPA: hypothetical protein VGL22_10665 [Terracidiphilus sp.]|jgi:hypothetical protein
MNDSLRPSTLGEILDRTASLYRSRFLVYFGLAAIPAALLLGLSGGAVLLFAWAGVTTSSSGTPNPEAIGGLLVGLMLLGMLALPLTLGSNALCGAALCHAASVQTLGESITMTAALKAVWKRGWQYIGLYVLQALMIAGIPFGVWTVLIMIVSVGAAVAGGANAGGAGMLLSGVLAVLLFVGLAVYVVWMLLQVCLAFPVAVIESAPIGVSLKRAWQLCRGTRGRMLVLFLLGIAVAWVASLLVSMPVIFLVSLVPGLSSPQHAAVMGTVMIIGVYGMSFAVHALTMPVFAIALVLFYYDQRVRREGFDVELMMQRAGMLAEAASQPEAAPWLAEVPRGAEAGGALGAMETEEAVVAAEPVHAPAGAAGDPDEPLHVQERLGSPSAGAGESA